MHRNRFRFQNSHIGICTILLPSITAITFTVFSFAVIGWSNIRVSPFWCQKISSPFKFKDRIVTSCSPVVLITCISGYSFTGTVSSCIKRIVPFLLSFMLLFLFVLLFFLYFHHFCYKIQVHEMSLPFRLL